MTDQAVTWCLFVFWILTLRTKPFEKFAIAENIPQKLGRSHSRKLRNEISLLKIER